MPYVMAAGLLDRRVRLQRPSSLGVDGDPRKVTWSTVATVWAGRMDKLTSEKYVAPSELSEAEAVYRIRHRIDITPTWRLVDGDFRWDIESVAEGRGRYQELMLLVTRDDPRGDVVTIGAPGVEELLWGSDPLEWGSDALTWGG